MKLDHIGFNDLHRLLAMETMGLDIPDSFINYQLFRGMVPPSQGFRTNTPFTSTRFSNSQATLNQRPRNTATSSSGSTTQTDTNPTRFNSPDFSAFFPNPTPVRSTNTNNNYMYQRMNPFFLAMMENFV